MTSSSLFATRAASVASVALMALPLLLVALVCTPQSVSAHGYLSTPPSRQALCRSGAVSNCGQIMYEPQSVEAPKGRRSCNGDIAMWSPLADESRNWPTTTLNAGVNTFRWTLTAAHATASYEYWIGNNRIALINGASTTHSVNLAGYSGRQKILSIWNIGDTVNAFYACTDVIIGSGGGSTTPAPTSAPTSAPTTRPTVAPTVAPTPSGGRCTTYITTYIVRAGDTLGRIAYSKGITLAALLAVNPAITNPNLIYVSQRISVPRTVCGLETNGTSEGSTGDGGAFGFTGVGNDENVVSDDSTSYNSGVELTETDNAIDLVSTGVGSHYHRDNSGRLDNYYSASAAPSTYGPALVAGVSATLLGMVAIALVQ
jgi:LysM repeat protein